MSLRLVKIGNANEANYNPHLKHFLKGTAKRKTRRQNKQLCLNNRKLA